LGKEKRRKEAKKRIRSREGKKGKQKKGNGRKKGKKKPPYRCVFFPLQALLIR